ncbi:MAG: hypothetical protein ACOY4T_00915 [Pseudomonadota bacterium]
MTDPMRGMGDDEGLAAEYVLGTLPLPDRTEAERRIVQDPAFAAMVAAWEGRLAGLNAGYAEAAPPAGVVQRVEARLFPLAPQRRRPWSVVAGAVAGLALAALAAGVVLPVVTPGPPAVTGG